MDGFARYLRGLQGKYVQLERGGPEACQGWLYSVHHDYLTLRSEDGADLHLPLHHIRSVTSLHELVPDSPPPEGVAPEAETFLQLLKMNVDRRVGLYHAGPEVCTGRLQEVAQDHLVLEVAPGETTCFTTFHVRSFYVLTDDADTSSAESTQPMQGR